MIQWKIHGEIWWNKLSSSQMRGASLYNTETFIMSINGTLVTFESLSI